ncbi:MAG: ABC transporter permease [Novosphingobium sp.]
MSADRLSHLQAAWVIARRDFVAVLFSRAFFFFLLGPLFPLVVGAMAGGIGQKVASEANQSDIGVVMAPADSKAMLAAYRELAPRLGTTLPRLVEMELPGDVADAEQFLRERRGQAAAIVTGTPATPVLTGPPEAIGNWRGPLSLVAASAASTDKPSYPEIATVAVATSAAKERAGRILTAQAGQMLLFLLTMLLAGMVLSNLVEEKGNKIIEVLAAAIPLDALFMGKLFAMLGVSIVGIAVWGSVGGTLTALGSGALPSLPEPGVGWPLFFVLGVIYFAMAYLLLGSIFLAIGSLANTVREVQTLSMPVTMAQLMVFFFASYALSQPDSWVGFAADVFPLSSPFAMLALAAQSERLAPHALALAWQALWVYLFVRAGAALFRRRVMKSGPARTSRARGIFSDLLRKTRRAAG